MTGARFYLSIADLSGWWGGDHSHDAPDLLRKRDALPTGRTGSVHDHERNHLEVDWIDLRTDPEYRALFVPDFRAA